MVEKEADLVVRFEHSENKDTQEIIKDLKSFLGNHKAKGNLDFKVVTRRKCDYCARTLTDEDKFTTTKDGENILDKCEDCEKKGK